VGTESSTSTTETETGDPSTTESETWSFVPDVPPPPVDCDMYEQDCPDGEKCVPTLGGPLEFFCVPILGDQAPGELCTFMGMWGQWVDDCDANSMCWDVMDVDGEWVGVCAPFCTGSPDSPECPVGSACLISGNGSLNICVGTCHPLLQDCSEGLACIWTADNFNCIFTAQELPAGQPCRAINDCAAGLMCLAAELLPVCDGSSCCSAFCDLSLGDGPCDALLPATVCVPLFDAGAEPPGYEDVGLCTAIPPP
jgi:hypothetical protein